GQVRPCDLDPTGAAVTSLPLDTPATVRAYDADGKLLGQTPVQPSKAAYGPGLPGESPATRVVPSATARQEDCLGHTAHLVDYTSTLMPLIGALAELRAFDW